MWSTLLIGGLAGSTGVFIWHVLDRDHDRRPSIFDRHPGFGVAVICMSILIAAWIDIR